jgi:hypothetical protein
MQIEIIYIHIIFGVLFRNMTFLPAYQKIYILRYFSKHLILSYIKYITIIIERVIIPLLKFSQLCVTHNILSK